jgi:hypothetical protein
MCIVRLAASRGIQPEVIHSNSIDSFDSNDASVIQSKKIYYCTELARKSIVVHFMILEELLEYKED